MSAWKDSDEVTTTYGSLQLGLEQAHAAGIKTERQRIIVLLEKLKSAPACFELHLDALIANIKGETNE